MLGFIFGMMIGSSIASGNVPPATQRMLTQIPFRCFAALEDSDNAYMACRYPSLRLEIHQACPSESQLRFEDEWKRDGCRLQKQMGYEIKALRSLEAAAKAKEGKQ